MAASLGSAGFAWFGQAQSTLSLLAAFGSNGLAAGVTKLTADKSDRANDYIGVWGTALAIAAFVGLALTSILLVSADYFATLLFGDAASAPYVRIVAIAVPFACCAPIFLAAITGQLHSVAAALAPMVANVTATIFAVWLCLAFGMTGAMLSVLAAQVVALIINALFLIQRNPRIRFSQFRPHMAYTRPLLGFGLMALVAGAASQTVAIYIRTSLAETYGWAEAGQWHAIMKISEIYLALATATLTMYYLPRLSKTNTFHDFLRLLVRSVAYVLPITLVASVLIFLLRDVIVAVVFTPEFSPIADMLWIQLVADFLRISSYFFAMVMWAKGMTRVFVLLEVAFAAVLVALADNLLARYGVLGVLYAQAVTYALYLLATIYVAFWLTPWIPRTRAS